MFHLRFNLRTLLWVVGFLSIVLTMGRALTKFAETHHLATVVIAAIAANWVFVIYWLLASAVRAIYHRWKTPRDGTIEPPVAVDS